MQWDKQILDKKIHMIFIFYNQNYISSSLHLIYLQLALVIFVMVLR